MLSLGNYLSFFFPPFQIVSLILSFLNYPSLQTARLVCKNWYHASLVPQLIQKEHFVLGQELASEDEELIKSDIQKLQNVISGKRNFNLKIKVKLLLRFNLDFSNMVTVGTNLESSDNLQLSAHIAGRQVFHKDFPWILEKYW